MKIAVTAGTPVDTGLGCKIIEDHGYEALSFPVAKNPEEQDRLQFLGQSTLEKKVEEIIDIGKEKDAKALFIYCNSLSTAIDYKKIEKNKNFKIITPLKVYEEYAKNFKSLGVIGANSQAVHGIEKVMKSQNLKLNLVTLGILPLVISIENHEEPKEIIEKLDIKNLLKFFENIKIDGGNIEALVLGCTHFPYIKDELYKISKLNILDPAEGMLELLDKIVKW